ncbi:MAG TPA: zinc-binding alcohol dehydrogenase family protein [Candidatus Dormibacteraeota bacterium]|nr:zinc-binding alcohol dehydrogenase family protein [Candidatus Dormibacteraeota bacterium]
MTETSMGAAVVARLGSAPSFQEIQRPTPKADQVLIRVAAAGLNPIDLRIASGTFYGGAPDVPYVPGSEGVGVVVDGSPDLRGERVRFETVRGGSGALAEWTVAAPQSCLPLPSKLDTATAAGLGVAGIAAWICLVDKVQLKAGESVLILGATGAVGQMAVQIAKLLGAGRIVAAGRDPGALARTLDLGADAVVTIAEQSPETVQQELLDAAGGPLNVIFDPVWGHPLEEAIGATAPSARVIHLGESAGSEATLSSAIVRGRQLTIIGHASPQTPWEMRARAFSEVADHAAAGRIHLSLEEIPLSEVSSAWHRQAASPHTKLVLIPAL